ncbi:MAG: DUF4221 family protein [Mangrovibacterium sp.]
MNNSKCGMVISVLIIIAILTGCSRNKNAETKVCPLKLTHQLKATGYKKEFKLPNDILCYASYLQLYQEDSGRQFLYFAGRENKILVFDYQNSKLIRKINLEEMGPNSVGKAFGFHVITPDSILIISRFTQTLNFVDSLGRKIFKYDYRDDQLQTTDTKSDFRTPVFVQDDLFFLYQGLKGNWNLLPLSEFKNYKPTLILNLKTGAKKKVGPKLPYPDSELRKKEFDYSIAKAGEKYLFSYVGSDIIFTTTDFEKFSGYLCKSQYVFGDLADYSGSSDVYNVIRRRVQSCYYAFIVWDPYREVFYRFYKVGERDLKNTDNLYDLNYYPPSFGIIVINKDMEIISDHVYENNKYFFGNFFIDEKGLYISVNHPNNPEMDYNKLTFELFELVKNNS